MEIFIFLSESGLVFSKVQHISNIRTFEFGKEIAFAIFTARFQHYFEYAKVIFQYYNDLTDFLFQRPGKAGI